MILPQYPKYLCKALLSIPTEVLFQMFGRRLVLLVREDHNHHLAGMNTYGCLHPLPYVPPLWPDWDPWVTYHQQFLRALSTTHHRDGQPSSSSSRKPQFRLRARERIRNIMFHLRMQFLFLIPLLTLRSMQLTNMGSSTMLNPRPTTRITSTLTCLVENWIFQLHTILNRQLAGFNGEIESYILYWTHVLSIY